MYPIKSNSKLSYFGSKHQLSALVQLLPICQENPPPCKMGNISSIEADEM